MGAYLPGAKPSAIASSMAWCGSKRGKNLPGEASSAGCCGNGVLNVGSAFASAKKNPPKRVFLGLRLNYFRCLPIKPAISNMVT